MYSEGGTLDNLNYQCWCKLQNLCAHTQSDVSSPLFSEVTDDSVQCLNSSIQPGSPNDSSFALSPSFIAEVIADVIGTDCLTSTEMAINTDSVDNHLVANCAQPDCQSGTEQSQDNTSSNLKAVLDQQPGTEQLITDMPHDEQLMCGALLDITMSNQHSVTVNLEIDKSGPDGESAAEQHLILETSTTGSVEQPTSECLDKNRSGPVDVPITDHQVTKQPGCERKDMDDNVSGRPQNFPFTNSSYPGDPDADVLPYPGKAARHGKRQKSDKQHYFLLTSKEAYEEKQKEKQNKMDKENQKREKVRIKNEKKAGKKQTNENPKSRSRSSQQKAKDKAPTQINKRSKRLLTPKENVPDPGTSKQSEDKQVCNRNRHKRNCRAADESSKQTAQCHQRKSARKSKCRNSNIAMEQQASDCCFICGEPETDPPTEEWIQCGDCFAWFHEQCINVEDGMFVCEKCG